MPVPVARRSPPRWYRLPAPTGDRMAVPPTWLPGQNQMARLSVAATQANHAKHFRAVRIPPSAPGSAGSSLSTPAVIRHLPGLAFPGTARASLFAGRQFVGLRTPVQVPAAPAWSRTVRTWSTPSRLSTRATAGWAGQLPGAAPLGDRPVRADEFPDRRRLLT